MTPSSKRMLAVWVLQRECFPVRGSQIWDWELTDRRHIKGKASHKIISDGKEPI